MVNRASLASSAILRYYSNRMEIIDIALLALALLLAIVTRAGMKRIVARRLGKASDALLEIDFWNATSGDVLSRALLLVELLSWGASLLMGVLIAGRILS
jgi:hypothetical protein